MFNFEKLETWQMAIHFAEEQGKMLSGLRRSVLKAA